MPERDYPLALIVATASCVWDDLAKWEALNPPSHLVLAINDMGLHYPGKIDFWVSSHWQYFEARPLREWRWRDHAKTVCMGGGPRVDEVWTPNPGGGDSTTLALQYAIQKLCCKRVVICGAPFDNSPHYYTKPGRKRDQSTTNDNGRAFDFHLHNYWKIGFGWDNRDKIRAFSGFPAQQLGQPTKEWIRDYS